MKTELDEILCARYPKIFCDRNGDMRDTAMCWGFACGDGWFNIIDMLCANIQNHIDGTRSRRASVLRFNRALERSTKDNLDPLIRYFQGKAESPRKWDIEQAKEMFEDIEPQCNTAPPACRQVVVSQVKEKFGTLRFYYHGGDKVVDGMVRMAESMSAVTCEECGNSGERRGGGWIITLCDTHAKERI
jgi:hypothetical protein